VRPLVYVDILTTECLLAGGRSSSQAGVVHAADLVVGHGAQVRTGASHAFTPRREYPIDDLGPEAFVVVTAADQDHQLQQPVRAFGVAERFGTPLPPGACDATQLGLGDGVGVRIDRDPCPRGHGGISTYALTLVPRSTACRQYPPGDGHMLC